MKERTIIITVEVSAQGLAQLLEKKPDIIYLAGVSDGGEELSIAAVKRLQSTCLWGE